MEKVPISTRRKMQANRGKDTKPELSLRKALWSTGVRGYRKNFKGIKGTPDIYFQKYHFAIFVNGCFWHRCEKCSPHTPKSNVDFWVAKFKRNVERDREIYRSLAQNKIHVLVVWECELKSGFEDIVNDIRYRLTYLKKLK